MKKTIQRVLAAVILFAMILSGGFSEVGKVHAEKQQGTTKRAIYVVFDNSGSMYGDGNKAWSQATYAMEVFAAMMNYESGDVMKVFPMHDITTDGNTGSATKSSMEIRGKDDIAQIHNMYTPKPGGTPYTQVNNAAGELTKLLNAGSVDEGWLVVLTDGDFDNDIPASGLKADLEGKAAANENLYVQYLAIGTDVKNIPEGNADKGLYAQKAGNTSEVVNELAEISNRIFKRNEYAGYSSEDSGLEFDIPLRKLIVFAQGKDVKIGSLKNEEGGEVKLQSDTAVSYSSTDGAGLTTFIKSTPVKDTSLKGQVAVFADESPIVAGNYTLDVSGADSIQIYYEPDVKFEAGLYKGDTKMEEGTIEGGAYTVKVGFVDQLSGKYIKSSKLLGEPKYTVSINGETQELTGKDGASQSIDVEVDGESLELTADVNYLKDYTDSASYTFKVCTLDINVDAFKSANLKTLEDGANQITVEATRNDQPLTKEQWDAATLDVVSVNKDGEEFGIQWDVQKGSEVSTWIVTPKYKKGGMFATETGQADVTINVSAEIDGDGYGKAETVSVNIKDDKNIVDYLKRYWKHIVISLLLLILILGYVPPFKKRFARSIKKRPSIECSAEKIGLRDNVMKGNFEKDLASRLLPYVPETGRLTFSPTPVKKTAKVRASGGGSMLILNTSAFAGKEEITFNGMSIQENEKGHHRISASTIIVVSTPEFTYTYFRNECLCKAMVDFNMIDTVSRGIKKMFNEQWRRHFPMPDYEIDAAKKKVVVRIYGNEINKRYTDLLKTDNTLSLWDCISLDAVQKGRFIHEDVAKDLLNRGLIEGDAPNYTISLGVAKATRQLQGYTKQKGLDKDKIKQMVLQYLKNAGSDGAKRDGIYEYIKDVMPQAKTREQQLRILGDILNALSVDKLIFANGRTWFLKE